MEDGIDNHQNIHCELYGTTPGWNICYVRVNLVSHVFE